MLAFGISVHSLEGWTFQLLDSAEHPLYVKFNSRDSIYDQAHTVEYRFKQTSNLLKRTKRTRAQIIQAML